MAQNSKIEWCDDTWNPVRGCSRVSPGCGGPGHAGGCYAEGVAARFSDPGHPYHGFAERDRSGSKWTGKVALIESQLTLPLRWKKPRRIFVNSMSDLFHEGLPASEIDKVFAVMALCPQHTFQVLTKRAERMRDYATRLDNEPVRDTVRRIVAAWPGKQPIPHEIVFPLANVWLGVSVEDQQRADERIPLLLETPAAVRFLSCEPLLEDVTVFSLDGPVDVPDGMASPIDWVICGGESGPNARPMALEWMRSLLDQCKIAGVPFFAKQLGSATGFNLHDKKGGDWNEWAADLRVREFPR